MTYTERTVIECDVLIDGTVIECDVVITEWRGEETVAECDALEGKVIDRNVLKGQLLLLFFFFFFFFFFFIFIFIPLLRGVDMGR